MAFIIDGHNLIGALPDIQLGDPEDELSLLGRLKAYRARAGGEPLVVFFDSGDLPGSFPDLSTPGLQVRFSRLGQSADDAILDFLATRAQPGQYAVVTNDHELSQRARLAGASVISATGFATRLSRRPAGPPAPVPGLDPHDPAFVDIYQAFIDADRRQRRLPERQQDPAIWLERLYGEDPDQAQQAAQWLGLHGGPQALPALRDGVTHSDVRVRAAALLALGDLGDRAALPDLVSRLRDDPGSLAREAAAQSLGRLGDRSVVAALQDAASSDSKNKVRKAARAALVQIEARTR